MASVMYVFETGSKHVKMFTAETEKCMTAEKSHPTPPKPLLVASPMEEGEYPVVVFSMDISSIIPSTLSCLPTLLLMDSL
jgi:Chlorophyllase